MATHSLGNGFGGRHSPRTPGTWGRTLGRFSGSSSRPDGGLSATGATNACGFKRNLATIEKKIVHPGIHLLEKIIIKGKLPFFISREVFVFTEIRQRFE